MASIIRGKKTVIKTTIINEFLDDDAIGLFLEKADCPLKLSQIKSYYSWESYGQKHEIYPNINIAGRVSGTSNVTVKHKKPAHKTPGATKRRNDNALG